MTSLNRPDGFPEYYTAASGAYVQRPFCRGLAARAPYFHDGSAATLMDVVNFYNRRFSIGLSAQEKIDLVNFLNSL